MYLSNDLSFTYNDHKLFLALGHVHTWQFSRILDAEMFYCISQMF